MTAEAADRATSLPPVGTIRARRLPAVISTVRHYPLGAAGGIIVVTFIFLAVFSPLLTPYDATRSVAAPLLAPSGKHVLGTDSLGQDVLSRVLQGSQISLAVAFSVMTINVSLGTLLGLNAGYFQGPIDYVIQRSAEVWTAFPVLIALLLIVSVLGPPHTTKTGNLLTTAWEMRNLILAFSIGALFGGSRVIRGATLVLKNQEFVTAARALDRKSVV